MTEQSRVLSCRRVGNYHSWDRGGNAEITGVEMSEVVAGSRRCRQVLGRSLGT
jgi:hypothetical protein